MTDQPKLRPVEEVANRLEHLGWAVQATELNQKDPPSRASMRAIIQADRRAAMEVMREACLDHPMEYPSRPLRRHIRTIDIDELLDQPVPKEEPQCKHPK